MKRISTTVFAVCPFMLLCWVGAARAEVVAQYLAPNNGYLAGFAGPPLTYVPAQTFTTTGGGELASVSVSLAANGGPPSSVLVEIRTVSGGFPTATVLGSASIPSPALTGTPQDFVADFSGSGVNLSALASYAMVLSMPDGGAWACGEFNGTYPGGLLVQSFDSGATFSPTFIPHDMQFTVTTVPEPSTSILIAFGMLAPFAAGRRRNRHH
jgi:hypothetical protein